MVVRYALTCRAVRRIQVVKRAITLCAPHAAVIHKGPTCTRVHKRWVETSIEGRLCAIAVGVISVVDERAGVGERETGAWQGDDDAEDTSIRLREFGGDLVGGGGGASERCRRCLRSSFEVPLTDAERGACVWW